MAKIVRPIILQLQNLSSCKDILNELKLEVENLNRRRESIIHEVEAGEVIEDEAVRWLNKVDRILRHADKLFEASRNANAGCLPNLKSQYQPGRKARKLTVDIHGLSAVKFDHINKIGIFGLDGVGDQTTLVKTVIKTVEDDKLFDGVIMTRVSKTLDVDRIQSEIADQLGFYLKEMTSERAGSLYEILEEKSILIIFYDIEGKIDLEKLGIPLEDHHKGCKLLLISRNEHILQENEIENKFRFRLKFLNDAELWSLCQTTPRAGVNEHDEKKILELTNHSSLERICNELEDKVVLHIFLLCGVYGKSILVSDLFKYIVGLGLFKHINSIDKARKELKKIIGVLKASFPTLVYVDDREIQMNGFLRDIAKKVAYENAPIFTMERNVPLKYWPSEDSLRKCTQIILGGNHNIQKLPEMWDCPVLELLHLDTTGNRTLTIPNSFFKGMTNLQVLDLIGMVIQPELPASLVSLTKLKTLCFNACSLGSMSGIGDLRNLDILSFCHSSMKDFPNEIGRLTHLRMLDLMSASEIGVSILQNILSNLTELEELCMENLYFHDQLIIDSLKNLSAVKNIVLPDSGLTIDEIESIPVRSLTLQHLPELNGFCCNDSEVLDIPTLFPDKEALFRPLEHLKVVGISRIMLLVITALSNGMMPLQNLETLEIVGCNDLQYLFVIKGLNMYGNYCGLLPDLHQLRLRNLVKLRSIVGLNNPRGTLSFKMLKDLIVCGCNQLRYVLPLYVLQNLHQLENIVINDCKMLEWVFGDEEEDKQITESNENTAAKNTVELPQVNSLILEELPEFAGCCQHGYLVKWLSLKKIRLVECPMIKKSSLGMIDRPLLTSVEVIECNTWTKNEPLENKIEYLFNFTNELFRIQELKIKDTEELRKYMEMKLQESSFTQLKTLEARQCNQELVNFLSLLLGRSDKLKELKVENCQQLEHVFNLTEIEFDGEEHKKPKFPNLETMQLLCLPKLTCIWNKDPREIVELGKLVKLEIIECGLLKSLLSTALVEKLVHLEELKVESCEMIEQVVEGDDTETKGRISFPNLKDLQLGRLPKLTKFNSGHCNMTFHNLQSLRIEECPELNAFTIGFLSKTTNEGTSYHVTPDEKMDTCPKLERLMLVGHKSLEDIWQGHVCNIPDCELKQVEVDSFTKLRYIFPSSKLQILLGKLETLVVRNCTSLSDVFQIRDNDSIMTFQNLTVIRVKGCDALEHLLLPFRYHKLTEIDISDCQSLRQVFVDTKIEADEKSFPDLKSIVLENLPMLSNFSLETFEFPKLEKARIVNCPEFKTFSRNVSARANNTDSSQSLPFGDGKTILLPELQVLALSDLPKMQLWNQEPQIPVFRNLASLKIIGCGSIDKLFSISVAQHLSSLKFLKLYKCENMVQVLQGGGGNSKRVFQNLETLVLKHLPRLSSFCEDEDVDFGEFPELRMVRVEDIPKMYTFVKKPLKTPKLKEVHVIFIRKCWQGDLNDTIKYLKQNHEKLKAEAWESDQSSTRHHTDTAESSF
ncbi:hypothetical protein K1719_032924 [Acacia pycnantha]|nr:hypothetical protein K1719_032924 [Acacia pycnantha]